MLIAGQVGAQTLGDELAKEASFSWRCVPTGKNSVQCQFKNTSTRPAGFCVEVAKVCKPGDHSAYVCTGQMSPGDVESRVVNNFDPKVKLFESCQGIEYRNKHFDQQ